MPRPYAPEFRRRALDLLQTDRSVRDVAASLGIAESCLHHWKSRDLVDRSLKSPTHNRLNPQRSPRPGRGSRSWRPRSRSCERRPLQWSRWCPQSTNRPRR